MKKKYYIEDYGGSKQEQILGGIEKLDTQNEKSICNKCNSEYIIVGWNFYGLCDTCWSTTPRRPLVPLGGGETLYDQKDKNKP